MSLLAELLLLEATPRVTALELQQRLLDAGFDEVDVKLSDWHPGKEKSDHEGYLLQCKCDRNLATKLVLKIPLSGEVIYFDYWVWVRLQQNAITLWLGNKPDPSRGGRVRRANTTYGYDYVSVDSVFEQFDAVGNS